LGSDAVTQSHSLRQLLQILVGALELLIQHLLGILLVTPEQVL
jgi:hypothetical protein